MTSEFKVGIVVIVGITLLFYMSFRIGKFGTFREGGYDLVVHFKDVAGLDTKSRVEVAGVEVGKVNKIGLDGYIAKAVLLIREGVKIPVDSRAAIRSQGILGEKYIEITPGTASQFLKNGQEIVNVAPYAGFDEIFATMSNAAKNFGDVMGEFKGAVGEKEKANIRESLDNIRALSGQFREMIAENRGDVHRVVENVAEVSDRIGPLVQRAEATISGMNAIIEDVGEGKGTLGLLVRDEKLYNDAKDTVATLKAVSADIEQGKGTLGKLVTDETLYTDAKETVQNIKQFTESISKGEGTLGKLATDTNLIDEAEKTMKKVQKAAEGIQEQTPITVLGTLFGLLF